MLRELFFIFFCLQCWVVPPLILASLRCKCRGWRLPGSVGVKWLTSLYCCHAAHYWFERRARWKAAVLLCIIHAQIPACQGERGRHTGSERERERMREREGNVEGGLCCVLEAHCVCRQACVCVCVTVCMHIWPQEWGAHADIYTVTKRSIRLGIQDQIKRVLPRHHLLWFPGTLLPFSTRTDTQIYTNPHCTHNLCSEFIGFKHVCGYPVVWKYWMAWRICENCGHISRRHTHTKLRFKTKPWGQDWLI